MMREHCVLIVSNIPWEFAWQRHQTIATCWAEDRSVIFLELPGIRRVGLRDLPRLLGRAAQLLKAPAVRESLPVNLRVLRPWILPATHRPFCVFNRHVLRQLIRREPALQRGVEVLWTYSASRTALDLIDGVKHRKLVYDCTDDWLAVKGVPSFLAADEQSLLRRADLTFVPSRVLAERKRPYARRLERVPHGAWVERFLVEPRPRPAAGAPLSVLYYGHVHGQHLDLQAIDRLARERPGWRVVLVGSVKTPYRFPPNVRLTGPCAHDQLRHHIAEADVLLLPYRLNRYTEAVMPAKTYECLATGRPVVATPLPELVAEVGPLFRFIGPGADWAAVTEEALSTDTPGLQERRRQLARMNAWSERFRQIRTLVDV